LDGDADTGFRGRPLRLGAGAAADAEAPGFRPRFGACDRDTSSRACMSHRSWARLRPPSLNVADCVAGSPQTSHTRITRSAISNPFRPRPRTLPYAIWTL